MINSGGINKSVAFQFMYFRILELNMVPEFNQFNYGFFFLFEEKEKGGPEMLDDLFEITQLVIKTRLES